MLTNECANRLMRELEIDISRMRVIRYANIIRVKKKDNEYRNITEDDYIKIKIIVCLFEVGVHQPHIIEFITNPLTVESFHKIITQVEKRTNIGNKTYQLLSEYTFNQIGVR